MPIRRLGSFVTKEKVFSKIDRAKRGKKDSEIRLRLGLTSTLVKRKGSSGEMVRALKALEKSKKMLKRTRY